MSEAPPRPRLVRADHGNGGPTTDLSECIDSYVRSLMREGKAPGTIKSYLWALDDFRRFLAAADVTTTERITWELLEHWQDALLRRLGPSSRGIAHAAIRQFLRWGEARDIMKPRLSDLVSHVRKRRPRPRPIPFDDLQILLRYVGPHWPHMSVVALRNRALFLYTLTTGARISEVLQVTRAEIREAVVWQKGGSEKVLFIPPACVEAVEDYLAVRTDACPWLWVTYDSNRPVRRLAYDGVRAIWQQVAPHAGVAPFTSHQLRHTAATELKAARIDDLTIANFMGHRGTSTLPTYVDIRDEGRLAAINAMQRLIRPRPA